MRYFAVLLIGIGFGALGGIHIVSKYFAPECVVEPLFEETISTNSHNIPNETHRDFRVSGPGFLRIDRIDNETIRYCVEVLYSSTCGQIERAFENTTLVYFVPHCQTSTIALEFVLVGEGAADQSLFYVDGVVTLDREEAEQWVSEYSGCELVQSI